MKLTVRRTAGIGDSLAATIVADLLHEQGHEVTWQCHPEIIPIIRRHPTIVHVEPPRGHCDVDLDGCYERSAYAIDTHFHNIFIHSAAYQLKELRAEDIRYTWNNNQIPKLKRNEKNEAALRAKIPFGPRVMICPRSNYLTRCVPDGIWREVADQIGHCYWIGHHPAPFRIFDCKCRTIEEVADYISIADLLITVDTGPMHIASAYGVPMVVVSQSHDVRLRLSPMSDFEVFKRNDLHCLNCQRHRCPIDPYSPPCGQIDPKELAAVVNRKLKSLESPIAA